MNQHASQVNCPKCDHQFDVQHILTQKAHQQMQQQLAEEKQKMLQDLQQKENTLRNYQKKLENDKFHIEKTVRARVKEQEEVFRKELREEEKHNFVREIAYLTGELKAKTEKVSQLQELQIEVKRLEQRNQEQKHTLELQYQEKMMAEKCTWETQMAERLEKQHLFKLEEKDLQLRTLEKQVNEMKRKLEQGSMQLQGEVQEVAIEDRLAELFPQDTITEVPKGRNGADVIQTVMNQQLIEAGKIVYESKRTKNFNFDWINKLKEDQLREGAHTAVLITETMPADIGRVEFIQGVWVTDFQSFPAVAKLLRDCILQVDRALISQQNKGEKMEMLYQFLTGQEFRMQIDAIVEGFLYLKTGIDRQKLMMKKLWKEQEKQIDKVLVNTTEMYGSIRGIAGKAMPDLPGLSLPEIDEDSDE